MSVGVTPILALGAAREALQKAPLMPSNVWWTIQDNLSVIARHLVEEVEVEEEREMAPLPPALTVMAQLTHANEILAKAGQATRVSESNMMAYIAYTHVMLASALAAQNGIDTVRESMGHG